ncbi:MAG TPA: hypothetical protein VJ508_06080 [Saprospiraceae bacterium]|nr:hypothetical protein [Saprospiraceae bacterium]
MYRTLIKTFSAVLLLFGLGLFIACQKEDSASSDVENFVLKSASAIDSRCGAGIAGCYELVFPVTLQFADSSQVSVNSYDELKQAIRDWYVANNAHPRPMNLPTIVFPFQVVNEAGEIITVENQEQLTALIALCRPIGPGGGGHDSLGHGGPGGHHGHHGGGGHDSIVGPCFIVNFPLTVSFPDSSQVTVNSPQELKEAIRTWNQNNPGTHHVRPGFVFPITVTLRDGTQVVVNSKEELAAIKEGCRG